MCRRGTFPLHARTQYVGGGACLFENPRIRQKYERREEVEASLARARGAVESSGDPEIRRTFGEFWVAARALRPAEVALASVDENLGLTLANYFVLHRRFPLPPESLLWRNYSHFGPQFGNLMLQLAYGLHALHELGIIHGDPHTNNIVLQHLTVKPEALEAYVLAPDPGSQEKSGEKTTYIVDALAVKPVFIDYGRSVVLLTPANAEAFRAAGDSLPALATSTAAARFVEAVAPTYWQSHAAAIGAAFVEHPVEAFAALTGGDYAFLGRKLGELLRGAPRADPPVELAPGAEALVARLEEIGLEHLEAGLTALAKGERPPGRCASRVFAELFADRRYAVARTAADFAGRPLVSIFRADAPLVTNLEARRQGRLPYPPWERATDGGERFLAQLAAEDAERARRAAALRAAHV